MSHGSSSCGQLKKLFRSLPVKIKYNQSVNSHFHIVILPEIQFAAQEFLILSLNNFTDIKLGEQFNNFQQNPPLQVISQSSYFSRTEIIVFSGSLLLGSRPRYHWRHYILYLNLKYCHPDDSIERSPLDKIPVEGSQEISDLNQPSPHRRS